METDGEQYTAVFPSGELAATKQPLVSASFIEQIESIETDQESCEVRELGTESMKPNQESLSEDNSFGVGGEYYPAN